MPPGEISVACPGCEHRISIPVGAIRRNNMYCPKCGKAVPLTNVQAPDPTGNAVGRSRPKKSSRTFRRR